MDIFRLFDGLRFYVLLLFDTVTYFSLLWGLFYLIDEAICGLLLRDMRYRAAGWRFMLILSACIMGFHSMPAVWCKNLLRGIFLASEPAGLVKANFFVNIIAVFSFLWLGCVIFQLIRYVYRRHTVAGCIRVLPDMPSDAAFTRAAMEIGVAPVCKVWDEAGGISIFGAYKPVVLVPAGSAQRYTDEERYYLYLHELTHIIRHDTLVALLTDILEIIFWIFPPIKWEMRRQRECREFSCDAAVLKHTVVSPIRYGRLLLGEIKTANNRLMVGFSSYRYRQTKARLNAVIGNVRTLSAKRLCIYMIIGVLLVSQLFTPSPNMPYQRMAGVMTTDGTAHLVYLEPYGSEPQSAEQLRELIYAEYDIQDISSMRVARIIFDWEGVFSTYSASRDDDMKLE